MNGSKFVLLALLAGLVACTSSPDPVPDGLLQGEPEFLPVREFGRRLGLTVSEISAGHATLRDDANSVVVFAPPSRWIYVNRRRIGPLADAVRRKDGLMVSRSLIQPVREVLDPILPRRPAPPPLPAPRPEPPRPEPPPVVDPPKPKPVPRDLVGKKVLIDPGHGGKDPGAISVLGFYEKAVVLKISRRVAALLVERGATVVLTRAGDSFIELNQRADKANREKPDLFVSIHADAANKKTARGYSAYVARTASGRSVNAARTILAALSRTGLPSRGMRRADYRVLVRTKCPAVLVELGFVSNRTDAAKLRDAAFQERMARALSGGIANTLKAP